MVEADKRMLTTKMIKFFILINIKLLKIYFVKIANEILAHRRSKDIANKIEMIGFGRQNNPFLNSFFWLRKFSKRMED